MESLLNEETRRLSTTMSLHLEGLFIRGSYRERKDYGFHGRFKSKHRSTSSKRKYVV
jgi:hypothetical protein